MDGLRTSAHPIVLVRILILYMIKPKTLLIVGAGASVPYGYPTGKTLRDELCTYSKLTDLHTKDMVHEYGVKFFCQHFYASQSYSIDAFLAKRGKDEIGNYSGSWSSQTYGTYENCGKLAIAHRLTQREISENLIVSPDDHWLQYLWNMMNDVPKNEFKKNNLKIISFNYDRVIEHYFQNVIEHDYGVSHNEAAELRNSIEIVHVYGTLQSLDERPYGVEPKNLYKVANCIKVIPEAREIDDTEFKKAAEMIQWAERICFIGFSFDPINVRRLGFPNHELSTKSIYFTRYGLTSKETLAASKSLGSSFDFLDYPGLNTYKTLQYIREEGVFLSL
jgi:hypothetical protein